MFLFDRKSVLACMEQKFSCLRLGTDNSQYWREPQMRTLILGGLLASAMLVPALAQTNPPPASVAESTAPKAHGEMWRSSKLIGLNVYNDQDEKLGAISEILLDKSGKVDFVVIGVGGFLGIGQQDIMVEMSKLKFVDEPVRTSSTTTSTTGSATPVAPNRPATTTTNHPPTTTTTTTTKSKWYPDHAVLSGATKDSLKNMAEFKYE
jgi:sporulation protein YlmC with PRC-barrel domain